MLGYSPWGYSPWGYGSMMNYGYDPFGYYSPWGYNSFAMVTAAVTMIASMATDIHLWAYSRPVVVILHDRDRGISRTYGPRVVNANNSRQQ